MVLEVLAQFKDLLCTPHPSYSSLSVVLAYSPLVLFRLFVGLHKINPVYVLISHTLALTIAFITKIPFTEGKFRRTQHINPKTTLLRGIPLLGGFSIILYGF